MSSSYYKVEMLNVAFGAITNAPQLLDSRNLDKQSVSVLKKSLADKIGNADYHIVIKPIEPKDEAVLEIKLGPDIRSEIFPPLKTEAKLISCEAYRDQGRTDTVSCNGATELGYYWLIIEPRRGPYWIWGLDPVPPQPSCNSVADPNFRGVTIRYPPANGHEHFLPVFADWTPSPPPRGQKPNEPHADSFQCNPEGKNDHEDWRYKCGVFFAVCRKQP